MVKIIGCGADSRDSILRFVGTEVAVSRNDN